LLDDGQQLARTTLVPRGGWPARRTASTATYMQELISRQAGWPSWPWCLAAGRNKQAGGRLCGRRNNGDHPGGGGGTWLGKATALRLETGWGEAARSVAAI